MASWRSGVEATATYRWFHDLVPPPEYQQPWDLARRRGRLVRGLASVKTCPRALLARHTMQPLDTFPFGPKGLYWFSKQDFDPVNNLVRDERLARFRHDAQVAAADEWLAGLRPLDPQAEALIELPGIGLDSALLFIGELGDVSGFRRAKQVAAYASLMSRADQSWSHCYHGHISKQCSPWLPWILVEAAMDLVHRDVPLANLSQRIRKRSSEDRPRGGGVEAGRDLLGKIGSVAGPAGGRGLNLCLRSHEQELRRARRRRGPTGELRLVRPRGRYRDCEWVKNAGE